MFKKKTSAILIITIFLNLNAFASNSRINNELISTLKSEIATSNVDKIKQLIKKGANVNAQDDFGNTPVHIATKNFQAENLALLVSYNPKLDTQNNNGNTPLMSFFDLKLKFGTINYAAQASKYTQIMDTYSNLIKKNTSKELGLNLVDNDGNNSLIGAVKLGSVDIIKSLVNKGVDINHKNNAGDTALLIASKSKKNTKQNMVSSLIRSNANILLDNNKGETILSKVSERDVKDLYRTIYTIRGQEAADHLLALSEVLFTKRGTNGEIILEIMSYNSKKSCSEILNLSEAISNWEDKVYSKKHLKYPKCEYRDNKCSVTIRPVQQGLLSKKFNKRSKSKGPNCFNSSLVGNGNLSSIRLTSNTEIKEFIDSSICRERKSYPSSGDIIVIYRNPSYGVNQIATHAFTYLNNKYSFSKNGLDTNSPYSIFENDIIHNMYGVKQDLQFTTSKYLETNNYKYANSISLTDRQNGGYAYSIAYDCTPNISSRLSLKPTSESLKYIMLDLDKLESEISSVIFDSNGKSKKDDWKKRLQKNIDEIYQLDIENKNDEVLFDMYIEKADSLQEQLSMLEIDIIMPFFF